MEWTYNIVVKTEASRNVPKAIDNLTKAQKVASNIFETISKLLSRDFLDSMLAALDNRMALWELKQNEIDLPAQFEPVKTALLEIRAGLVTLLDLKEGSFTNTLNTLRVATDAMKESGGTIEDAMVEAYKNMYGGMEGIEFASKKGARGIYDQLPSSIADFGSESFFGFDEKSKEFTGFNNKFLQAMIGDLDSVLQNYPETMAKQIKEELDQFLVGMGTGTEIFEKLLGKGTLDYKNWKILQEGLGDINKARKIFKENISDEYDPNAKRKPSKADEAVMQDVAKPLALGLTAVGDPSRWDQLKEALQKSFIQQLQESGSDILKSVESFGIVSSLFEIVYDQIRDSLVKEAHDQSAPPRGRALSITQLIRGGLKLGKEEIFDLSALKDSIQEAISYGQDPFGLNTIIRDELEQTLLKSKAEFDPKVEGEDYVSLKDVILKNLEESNLPEIVKSTLSEVLAEVQDDFGDALQTELGEMFSKIIPDLDKILQIEKLATNLASVLEIIENVNELDITPGTTEKAEVNRNATFDLESVLINNFKEARDHSENLLKNIVGNAEYTILHELEVMWGDILANIGNLGIAISNIEIPDQYPATADQIKKK